MVLFCPKEKWRSRVIAIRISIGNLSRNKKKEVWTKLGIINETVNQNQYTTAIRISCENVDFAAWQMIFR